MLALSWTNNSQIQVLVSRLLAILASCKYNDACCHSLQLSSTNTKTEGLQTPITNRKDKRIMTKYLLQRIFWPFIKWPAASSEVNKLAFPSISYWQAVSWINDAALLQSFQRQVSVMIKLKIPVNSTPMEKGNHNYNLLNKPFNGKWSKACIIHEFTVKIKTNSPSSTINGYGTLHKVSIECSNLCLNRFCSIFNFKSWRAHIRWVKSNNSNIMALGKIKLISRS